MRACRPTVQCDRRKQSGHRGCHGRIFNPTLRVRFDRDSQVDKGWFVDYNKGKHEGRQDMEEEFCFSGYCRAQDQARTVLLEWTGDSWEADCDFPDCPFAAACPVAAKMEEVSHA